MAYTGTSIVDYLNSTGGNSSFANRATLAGQQGIQNYTGTAEQNLSLLGKLQAGTAPVMNAPLNAPLNPNVTVNPTISTGTIGTQPLNLGNTQPNTTSSSGIMGTGDQQIQGYIDQQAKDAQVKSDTANSDLANRIKQYTDIQGSRATEEANANIPGLSQLSNDTYSALQASKRAQQVETQNILNSAGTKEQAQASINELNRKYSFEQADLSIAYDVANRNYSGAQATVDRKIQLELEPLKTLIDYQQNIVNNNADLLSKAQTTKLNYMIDQNKAKLETQAADAKAKNDAKLELLKVAQENGDSLNASNIMRLDTTSSTFQNDLAILQNKITAKVSPVTRSGISSGGSTGSGTNPKLFTQTQLNSGAVNAGVGIDAFSKFDDDTKNYFINTSSSELQKKIQSTITAPLTAGSQTAEQLKAQIESSTLPQGVKDYLKTKVDEQSKTVQPKSWWDNLKGFFGY